MLSTCLPFPPFYPDTWTSILTLDQSLQEACVYYRFNLWSGAAMR